MRVVLRAMLVVGGTRLRGIESLRGYKTSVIKATPLTGQWSHWLHTLTHDLLFKTQCGPNERNDTSAKLYQARVVDQQRHYRTSDFEDRQVLVQTKGIRTL